MRLTIAYSKIKKRNLVLINNDTYQRETLSEWPIRQPLSKHVEPFSKLSVSMDKLQKALQTCREQIGLQAFSKQVQALS